MDVKNRLKHKIVNYIKKTAVLLVCASVCFADAAATYEYPDEFWQANSSYENALNSENYYDIITYGNESINIMKNAADGDEKRNVMVTRYNQVGLAYAALGEYDSSADTFEAMYDYVSQYGDDFYDYKKVSAARAKQYRSEIKMYTDDGGSPYYGARNEKENGVLFGVCANGATRSRLDNESMVLVYQEIGDSLSSYNKNIVQAAAQKGLAVEIALNCPNQGDDISGIVMKTRYLRKLSEMFSQYPDTAFYLRFAAEFDIWQNMADAKSFKTAFRYVADYFHLKNKNVAMVWSPNQVSSWHVNTDDYYPGDKYVDWVGVSLYAQKYFLADKTQSDENEVVFRTGINSEPVPAMKDIVEKYGGRKPIMLSESGCGHRIMNSGEDTGDFALRRLREYYSYLPMVYPQIKLIAYFDWYAPPENNDYSLSSNTALQNEYLHLTQGSRFIQGGYNSSTDFCYRAVGNGTSVDSVFTVSCYAHRYNTQTKKVTYYIDGEYAAVSEQIPYTAYIDASDFSGAHTLEAVAEFENGQTLTRSDNIIIADKAKDISVKILGETVSFDRKPVLYHGRTLVPMRKIFESLGTEITWNSDTQTVHGKKDGRSIAVSVGSRVMRVDGNIVMLDTQPIVVSDRTLVPVRAIAEGLGCGVEWDQRSASVFIEPK